MRSEEYEYEIEDEYSEEQNERLEERHLVFVDGEWTVLENKKDKKKEVDRQRQKAVEKAWLKERELVLAGRGTRDWTLGQQAELIKYGRVSGFEGQHMLNVADHLKQAGNAENIQFLTFEEHFYGAHDENFRNATEGYFDPFSGKMHYEMQGAVPIIPEIELSNKYDVAQHEILSQWAPEFGYDRKDGYTDSREKHKGECSLGKLKKYNES